MNAPSQKRLNQIVKWARRAMKKLDGSVPGWLNEGQLVEQILRQQAWIEAHSVVPGPGEKPGPKPFRPMLLHEKLEHSERARWHNDIRRHEPGFCDRAELPRVTPEEHDWLVRNYPRTAAYTRIFRYPERTWMEPTDKRSEARAPMIREVWIGSRSLGDRHIMTLDGQELDDRFYAKHIDEDGNSVSGYEKSLEEAEDAAELTELQTMLYHDPVTGYPMIEDPDTGKLRRIRNGDVITIVRGSNDDLDELFMDAPGDPRMQNDFSAGGTDHRYSDRFRANTYLETKFKEDPYYLGVNTKECIDPDYLWNPDDLTIRRLAQGMAERYLPDPETHGGGRLQEVTDKAEAQIRKMLKSFQIQDGVQVSGYFVTRNDFFATLDQIQQHNRPVVKGRPKPVDWSVIRGQPLSRPGPSVPAR